MQAHAKVVVWIGIVLLVIVAGLADYATGPDLGFSFMYLPAVSMAAWLLGLSASLGVAVAAAAAVQMADALWRVQHVVSISPWVGMTHLVAFALVAFAIDRLRDREARLAHLNRELRESLARERALARTDPLTGLVNSRAFFEELGRACARSQRTRQPITLAYIDLDDFKRVNDFRGHAAGDELLQGVGDLLSKALRQGDVAARIGGDEFAVVLHAISATEAQLIAYRIVEGIAKLTGAHFSPAKGASVGLVTPQVGQVVCVDELVQHADAAMYEAKARGKGSVVVSPWPSTQPQSAQAC